MSRKSCDSHLNRGPVLKILAITAGMIFLAGADPATAQRPDSSAVDTTREIRSPRAAMLRSLALPGWGQFYNGRTFKGSLIAAAEAGSVVAFFVRRNQLNTNPSGSLSDRNIYFFTTLGLILFSMGDAYVDAHLDRVDWGDVEIKPGEDGVELRLKLRVKF